MQFIYISKENTKELNMKRWRSGVEPWIYSVVNLNLLNWVSFESKHFRNTGEMCFSFLFRSKLLIIMDFESLRLELFERNILQKYKMLKQYFQFEMYWFTHLFIVYLTSAIYYTYSFQNINNLISCSRSKILNWFRK